MVLTLQLKQSEAKIRLKDIGKGNTGGGVTGNEARKVFREPELLAAQVPNYSCI